MSWKYMGCSAHNVPSLSNVAMRSAGGTKSTEPCLVTRSTKSKIAFLGAVSFQDGRGSVTGVCLVGAAGSCGSADVGRSIRSAGTVANADTSARRLSFKIVLRDVILVIPYSKRLTTQRNPTWLVDV